MASVKHHSARAPSEKPIELRRGGHCDLDRTNPNKFARSKAIVQRPTVPDYQLAHTAAFRL